MPGKIVLIQLFRGIAASLVLLYHATNSFQEKLNLGFLDGFFAYGNAGVDFFFVLSGFIILYTHYEDIGKRTALKKYLTKRFVRVYPIYWIATLAVLPIFFTSFGSNFGTGQETHLSVIVKSLVLFPQVILPILSVAWTLSHEILFYLLFGALVVYRPKYGISALIGWVFLSFLFFVLQLKTYFLVDFFFSKFNLEFAAGCVAAYLVKNHHDKIKHPIIITSLGCVGFLAVMRFHPVVSNIVDPLVFYGIFSALIIVGACQINLKQGKPTELMGIFGDMSYSLYLIHIPISAVILKVITKSGLMSVIGATATMFVVVLLMFMSGYIFYRVIEKPLLAWLNRKLIKKPKSFPVTTKEVTV